MSVIHFLNVKEGDCSIIEHTSGHNSAIDVCNARKPELRGLGSLFSESSAEIESILRASSGNFNQKAYPVNPIEYMKERNINSVFRFILTHPDMDHMDGIKDFFEVFSPNNFYDTDNNKEISDSDFLSGGQYRKEDWEFYKTLRDGNPQTDPKRLTLFSGDHGPYRTEDWNGNAPGDGIYVLAPTPELCDDANESEDYNDCSYVILHVYNGCKVLFGGDSHDKTWEHLVKNHASLITNIDLFIAPHHGRKSGRNYSFLDIVNPKLTLFGNAPSQHLAYSAWNSRGLPYITNNQANCIITDFSLPNMPVYVTNESFARSRNQYTFYSDNFDAWYLQDVNPSARPRSLLGSILTSDIY